MRYSVYIFLLLFLLYGCSSSSVREQYGLKLKEFPIDCDSLIKSIEIDRLGDAEFSSEVTQVEENMILCWKFILMGRDMLRKMRSRR